MAELGDLQVRLSVKDELSPALRRVGWTLWWFQHRDAAMLAVWTLVTFVVGLLFGRFV